VDSSLGSGGSGSSGGSGGGAHQSSAGFDGTPYSSGSSAAAAAAYYSAGSGSGSALGSAAADRAKHGHHGLAFWPNDYKYPDCNAAAAFGAQTAWCNYSPYASRVPSHMDSYGSHLGAASITAAAAAAADEQRRSGPIDPPSFHDTYGLRNPYGSAAELAASPYPPTGQYYIFISLILFPCLCKCILCSCW